MQGNEATVYDEFSLTIDPNIPLTGYPGCDWVDTAYFIHAVAKTGKVLDDVVVKLPIVIRQRKEEAEEVKKDARENEDVVTSPLENAMDNDEVEIGDDDDMEDDVMSDNGDVDDDDMD